MTEFTVVRSGNDAAVVTAVPDIFAGGVAVAAVAYGFRVGLPTGYCSAYTAGSYRNPHRFAITTREVIAESAWCDGVTGDI